ncbi:MAG: PhzF family phenazine biosynthesis protein [Acidobacteria bacterium]|nr:PhzF family phenazine biosynthesis protein [Acidobacteriota bacterium]
MNLDIFQVDAFTNHLFAGNPAAVCPLTEWLADNVMLKIAAENNLSETAFFVKRNDRYEIRWFTPTVEINLCGHATLTASFVIFNCLNLENEHIKFYSHRSGDLSVEKQGDVLVLDFPAYDLNETVILKDLVESVGKMPKQVWETQGNMAMLLFETEDDVKNLEPDMSALSKLKYDEVIVTSKGKSADFVSRLFAPRIGIPEDPVTGATHCSLIPYWAKQLGKEKLYARQLSKRGGELFCESNGERVKIGGNAVLYLKGEIYV